MKNKLFTILFIFLNIVSVVAQQSKTLQEIEKILSKIDEANWNKDEYSSYKSKITDLENRCKTFDCGEIPIRLILYQVENEVNSGKSNLLYKEVLPLLEKQQIHTPTIQAFAHELAGLYYILNAKNDSCYYHLKIAEKLLQENAPTDKRFGMVNEYLGFYYSFQNIHDTSLIYMEKAIDIHFQNQDTLAAIKSSKYLSSFYNVMGDTESSIKTLLATKKLVNNFPAAEYFLNRIDAGLANAYLSLEDFKKVEQVAKKAIKRIEKVTTTRSIAVDLWDFYLILAEVKIKTNRTQEALQDIETAKVICEKFELANLHTINTLFYEAEIQVLLSKYEEAEQTLVKLHKDFNSDELGSYRIKTADLLYKLVESEYQFQSDMLQKFKQQIQQMAEKTNDYNNDALKIFRLKTVYDILDNNSKNALASFHKVLTINDSIQTQKHNTELNKLLIRQENLEQAQQLAKQEIELKDKTIQRNALIAGFLLILIIVGGLIFRTREKQRLNQLLEQKIKERTEELRLANAQLTKSNKELERFNYIVAHDLKEPLRNILGFISLINRRKMIDNSELQEFFNHIATNGNQMDLLLQNIIQYVNITNKSIKLSTVDISLVLSEIMQEEAIAINAKNAVINFEYVPEVQTDKEAIYSVFKNLIDNGLKFNTATKPTIDISYENLPNQHQFLIKDNGIGISSEYHGQVFILFKRLHHRGKYKGAGVGLAMCKQIIENLGGSIHIENNKNQGTTFKVLLPKNT